MKKLIFTAVIILLMLFAISSYFYLIMPGKIVTHWNSSGQPNGIMGKFWGLFLIPIIALGLFLLFILIPKIDPLKKNIEKFKKSYESFILVMILFLFYIQVLTIFWNSGLTFNLLTALMPAFGFLFFYIGILLKNIKQNWFIGIRTPWTLSSENVWDKTHKLGSILFKISGIITLAGIFFEKYSILFILVPVIASAVWLFIYSYLEWKKEKR